MSILRPYPGEIFYSWVTRMYNLYTRPERSFIGEMFGMNTIGIYKVKKFQDPLLQILLPVEEIIKYQSIAPLLQICMGRKEYEDMVENIDKEKFARYKWPVYAKVCSGCYEEDIEKYGEPYLHVEYQLPENLVCHKHHIDLTEIKEGFVAGGGVELVVLPCRSIEKSYEYNNPFYFEISEMIEKIFVGGILGDIYLEEAQEKYKSKLREKGYYMHTQLDRQSVANDLIMYFGHTVLDAVGASLKDDIGWISSITQKQQVKLKLICHLVIIKFLFEFIEAFVMYESVAYEPFGKAPWPCLNPFCKEYMKENIQEVYIKKGRTRGLVTGTWECKKCGFKYTRQGPDKKAGDRYRIGIVNEYGKVFDNKVRDVCQDTSLELRELAKLLYCGDAGTLRNHMKRVGIDPTLYSKGMAYDSEEVRIEKYKKRFLTKIQDNPNITFKEIRETFGYKLLKKKDPAFCEKYFPSSTMVSVGTKAFEERDKAIARQIYQIAEEVIKKNREVQLTKHFFRLQVGYSGIEKKDTLSKMPLTQQALEKYCETKEQYTRRRTNRKRD